MHVVMDEAREVAVGYLPTSLDRGNFAAAHFLPGTQQRAAVRHKP